MADLTLLILTLFWGTTFTLVKDVLAFASPGAFLSARFATAVVLLGAVALWRRDRRNPGFWRHGLLLGLFLLLTFVFQTVGLRYTTPARSGFLTGMSVLLVPFVSRFWLGRRVRVAAWAGVALAVVGLATLTRPFGQAVTPEMRLGDALTIGCALACALQIALMSEWAPHQPAVPFTVVQLAVTLAGALVLAAVERASGGLRFDVARGGGTIAGTVAFTGVAMTAGAFFIQNWGQARTTAVRAALIFSLEPVTAALFSHYYGGEPLVTLDWVGGGLIVLGVVLGEVGGALEARAMAAAQAARPIAAAQAAGPIAAAQPVARPEGTAGDGAPLG